MCVAGAPTTLRADLMMMVPLRADLMMIDSAQSAKTVEIKAAMEDSGRAKEEETLPQDIHSGTCCKSCILA